MNMRIKRQFEKTIIRNSLLAIVFVSGFFSLNVLAEHQKLIMGRSSEAFPETMTTLQESIRKSGYTLSVVQRVDIGLAGMGFETDKYRVVFFGKPEEIKNLPKKYPELTPYLPLAISIFAEEDETILTAMSPHFIEHSYDTQELRETFSRWHKDIEKIIEAVVNSD
ncbi:MAG: DUF302 domain-containing protein [Gammaproteobacteria bacterium]|nr:DUF302 domain-containing protein [Gammaproteobacteria bacterium]